MKILLSALTTLFFICTSYSSSAQTINDTIVATKELGEIIISGSKFAEKKKNIIQKIEVITTADIRKANAQNIGDLLMSTGNIFVQKSQQGGSSPIIRGFEASRILLVIDGVRMNNAIYRSGHLQNAITVDQNMLTSIEILQGPSSTLFGSDALGGAVHLITKQPLLSKTDKKKKIETNSLIRYSSANKEKTIHGDINIGFKKMAFLSSITFSDFGDVRMGRKDISGFEGFGTRPYYIQPYNGTTGDTILKNNNDRVQKFSGYKQMDLMQKVLLKPNENTSHTLNLQSSTSSNIPRYDRLQDIKFAMLRFASWYYGPQNRSLISYNLNLKNRNGFFNEYSATASYQFIEESRITREYKKYDQLDKRTEQVKVGGITLDARKKMKQDEITSGIDIQINGVESVAKRTNIITHIDSKLDTRYPDGKNSMNNFAIYTQHIHKFKKQKWVLNEGIRIQHIALKSNIVDNTFFFLPFTEIVQKNTAVNGNIGMAFMPSEKSRIHFGYSSGFRAPNIDDLAKIFESSTASKQVVVPNPNIKPEYTSTVELGIKQKVSQIIEIEFDSYYTNFTNAIVKSPYRLNGQDSILYNNVLSQVLASQNINHAYIFGGTFQVNAKLGDAWRLLGNINFTKGRFFTDIKKKSSVYSPLPNGTYALEFVNVSSKPLDHIPPIFGKLSIGYDDKKYSAEIYFQYNGWKRLDQFNADGEDNAQYTTNQGAPAWQTLNFRASFNAKKRVFVQVGIENIFDLSYRYFASGFSAPGRNFILSLRTSL